MVKSAGVASCNPGFDAEEKIKEEKKIREKENSKREEH